MGDRFRRLWILDITPQKRLELDPGSIADQHREVSGGPCSRRMMFAPCAVAAVFVKRNQAISALSTEPAIGGHNEVFKIDVLQLGIVAGYEVNCRFFDLDYGAARGNQFS
jgi:hypothetical protein